MNQRQSFRIPCTCLYQDNETQIGEGPSILLFWYRCSQSFVHRKELVRGTAEYGHAFEHLVIQELRAWLSYKESTEQLSYWRAYTGQEVDAVIGDARVAIEIKSVEEVLPRHLKGLKTFASDYPESKLLIV